MAITTASSVREAVGVFASLETLQAAIDELLSSGFDRAELSLLASGKAVDEKLGHKYRKVVELEDDPLVPRRAYVQLMRQNLPPAVPALMVLFRRTAGPESRVRARAKCP